MYENYKHMIQKIGLIIIIFILVILLFKDCGRTPADDNLLQLQQNLSYYKDSLIKERNLNGDLEYKRSVLATSLKDLEKTNKYLYDELQKEKGNVIFLNSVKIKLENEIRILKGTDPGIIIIKNKNNHKILLKIDTTYSKGNSRLLITETSFVTNDTCGINRDSLQIKVLKDITEFSLVTGLSENTEKLLQIFVRSDYPGFSVSQLDGAIIDPHKSELIKSYFPEKRIGVGVNIGYGLGIIDNSIKIGPYIGVGISYNLFQFNHKKLFKK
jgi:hypothetical protein